MPTVAAPPTAPAPTTTPTPTPSAPAQPVTMPAPAVAPTVQDPDNFFNKLDDTPKSPMEPAPKPEKGGEQPPKPAKPSDKPDPKGKTEPAPKPPGDQPEQFKTPKELRQAYDRTANELKSKNAEVVRLLQQLEAAKAEGSTTPPAELTALTERLARREQEYQTLQSELKLLRYERSPEYKEKFEQPYNQAYQRALQSVAGLTVKSINKETGEVTERQATTKDFETVLGQPTEGAAYRTARELFGDDHQLVIRHYDRLIEIAQQSQQEISKYRAEAVERDKTETARQATEREAMQAMSRRADDGWSKRSKWFAPIEGDEEGNALLQKGMERAGLDEESMEPKQRAIYQSYKKHAAAAFPRLQAKVTDYEARIADLKQKLAEFQDSEPGPGKTTPSIKPDTGVAPDAMSDPKAPWNK